MKEKLLISSCLLGNNVKYNGKNNSLNADILNKLKDKYDLYPICPEVFGGLSIPRDPSEIKGNRVFSNKGIDVTKEFKMGANKALEIAIKYGIKLALLKEGSPSCGVSKIYDGTFSANKIDGQGITAELFKIFDIKAYNENDVNLLLNR